MYGKVRNRKAFANSKNQDSVSRESPFTYVISIAISLVRHGFESKNVFIVRNWYPYHMIKIESKRSLGQIVFVLSLLRSWAAFDDYRLECGVHIGN